MENKKMDPRTAYILRHLFTFFVLATLIFSGILIVNHIKAKKDAETIENTYNLACTQFDEGRYSDALSNFNSVLASGDYKDAAEKKDICTEKLYEQSLKYAFEGDLANAELIFTTLPATYKDIASRKETISTFKKFSGTWKCSSGKLYLKTSVYIDYDNTPKIRAELADLEATIFDDPITVPGDDIKINTDRFSWKIYGDYQYSFVYNQNSYTMLKQPVEAGTTKYEFNRIHDSDYEEAISENATLNF